MTCTGELGGETVEGRFHLVGLWSGRADEVGDGHHRHRGAEQHDAHAEQWPPRMPR
jgi:hypothetical protein